MTTAEREAYSRLLLGVRTSLEAAHEMVTGVMQMLNAEAEKDKPAGRPEKPIPRTMGRENDDPKPGA